MILNNYCIIILGKIENISHRLIIEKISENGVNFIENKGIYMGTFISSLNPVEIKNLFDDFNFSVFVFNLNEENSSVRVNNTERHNLLFDFISENKELNDVIIDKSENNLDYIDNLPQDEKNKLMNQIIDKGLDNISDEDRKILNIISN